MEQIFKNLNRHPNKPYHSRLTIDESKRRLQATLERGAKRSRTRQHALDDLLEIPFKKSSPSLTATSSSTDETPPLHTVGVDAVGAHDTLVLSGGEEGSDGDASDAMMATENEHNGSDGGGAGDIGVKTLTDEEAVVQRLCCFWTNMSEAGSCLLLDGSAENGGVVDAEQGAEGEGKARSEEKSG